MMPLLLLVCTLPVDKRVCLGHLKVKRFVCMYQPGLTKMVSSNSMDTFSSKNVTRLKELTWEYCLI